MRELGRDIEDNRGRDIKGNRGKDIKSNRVFEYIICSF